MYTCVNCGKEITSRAKRCSSCAKVGKRNSVFRHDILEKTVLELYITQKLRIKKIAEILRCSRTPIYRVLIKHKALRSKSEARIKTNNSFYGKHHTDRQRRKWSISRSGEKHWNWKGGISIIPFEEKYGISPEEWKILVQKIRKRDNFICQYCGKKNSTSVHHILPKRIKIDNHPDNLITLCRSCHMKIERLTDKCLKENKDPIEIFYEKWSK